MRQLKWAVVVGFLALAVGAVGVLHGCMSYLLQSDDGQIATLRRRLDGTVFDLVFVMTFGGPGYATDMPGLNMFITTFRQDLFARGAAIATVLLLMVAILIVPYLVWNLRGETER